MEKINQFILRLSEPRSASSRFAEEKDSKEVKTYFFIHFSIRIKIQGVLIFRKCKVKIRDCKYFVFFSNVKYYCDE